MIAPELEHKLTSELHPNESLVWAGTPNGYPSNMIKLCIFFGVLPVILAAPLVYALSTGDRSIFETMNFTINGEQVDADTPDSTLREGVVTIGFILFFLIAGTAYWIRMRMREVYALTQTRAIIIKCYPFRRLASFPFHSLTRVERNGNNKIGTVMLFAEKPDLFERLLNFYGHQPNSFMKVENPIEVESLVMKSISSSKESAQQ